jgi:Spy/CpxP family protein refolding chaperone
MFSPVSPFSGPECGSAIGGVLYKALQSKDERITFAQYLHLRTPAFRRDSNQGDRMLVRRFARIAFPLLALTAGAIFLAGCRGRHCGWRSSPEQKADHIVKRIAKELDLTPDQRTKLEKIKVDVLARKADFSAIHAGIRDEFFSQLRSPKVDEAKLNQSLEDREAKMKEMRSFMVSEFAQFHAMLDSTQREKLASKLQGYCR